MEYPDHTPPPPQPFQGPNDPPEDPDDPPEVATGEGGTVRPRDIQIRILTPKQDQVFTADGNGLVSLELHGKVTYKKQSGNQDIVSLPDRYYKWLIDRDPTVILTGAQGTAQVHLAPGKHNVVLRVGDSSHSASVTIEVVAGLAPPSDPDPKTDSEPTSLFERIRNFFRKLFGIK